MLAHGREERRSKRTPRRNAAWIGVADNAQRIPCVLWDLSEGGARLAAPRAATLPSAFKLLMTNDGQTHRLCRVVWRKGRQLGVQFVEALRDDEMDSPMPARSAPPLSPGESQSIAATLVLPGCGPHVPISVEQVESRGLPVSAFAVGAAALLFAATIFLLVVGLQSAGDVPWAQGVCSDVDQFCRHPEWTGVGSALMLVVYLAVRGMES